LYPVHVKEQLNKIRPGLTGIGSIVFRDEEGILEKNRNMTYDQCYSDIIAPYKGELELWYIKHQSIVMYFTLIILTVWIVLFSKSSPHTTLFKDLPVPPPELVL
jgi:lipopolysaccharide/colanic/teichoic acid biosynthesis glycosyltransferase